MNYTNHINRIFRENYEAMSALALSILHDEDMARDVVHDLFADLISRSHKSDIPDQPDQSPQTCSSECPEITPSYLLRSTRNRCLNRLRHLSVRERIHKLYILDIDEAESEEWPDEELLSEIASTVEKRLSPQHRHIMEMRFRQGLETKQIASELGISPQAVYKSISRAIDILRTKLKNL